MRDGAWMKEWTDVRTLIHDDEFMKRIAYGHSRFLPLHIAFLFIGKMLRSVSSNTTVFGHAEHNCIRALKPHVAKSHKSMKLIVVRISSNRTFGMSRPCYHCCIILRHNLPRARVFYTNESGDLIEDFELDNTHMSLSKRNMVCRVI